MALIRVKIIAPVPGVMRVGERILLGGAVGCRLPVPLGVIIALSWTVVCVLQASAEQGQDPQRSSTGLPVSAVGEGGSLGSVPAEQIKKSGSESSTRAAEPVQGPALTVPEEMVAMFQQRKQDLDRRENAVRAAEAQLAILKAEVEKILSKVEAVEQRRLAQGNAAVSTGFTG